MSNWQSNHENWDLEACFILEDLSFDKARETDMVVPLPHQSVSSQLPADVAPAFWRQPHLFLFVLTMTVLVGMLIIPRQHNFLGISVYLTFSLSTIAQLGKYLRDENLTLPFLCFSAPWLWQWCGSRRIEMRGNPFKVNRPQPQFPPCLLQMLLMHMLPAEKHGWRLLSYFPFWQQILQQCYITHLAEPNNLPHEVSCLSTGSFHYSKGSVLLCYSHPATS